MVEHEPQDSDLANAELTLLSRNPALQELMDRHPALWRETAQELIAALADGRAQPLNDYAAKARSSAVMWESRIGRSGRNPAVVRSALPHLVKSRLALLALEKCCFAAATGKTSGRVRFNRINGLVIQKLLFERHLTRKPASLGWFRLWWPLLWQRRLLMPLVQPQGIFCFYTRELVSELAALIGERRCIEIAAGDGTLARFLAGQGAQVSATDNFSWSTIRYPDFVERLDAKAALEKYQPQVVLCSWPPPGNAFERCVFASRSVEVYVVIGSRYRFASGNWDAYAAQNRFEWATDERLSRHVIPPELESAVLVFRRKASALDHEREPQ